MPRVVPPVSTVYCPSTKTGCKTPPVLKAYKSPVSETPNNRSAYAPPSTLRGPRDNPANEMGAKVAPGSLTAPTSVSAADHVLIVYKLPLSATAYIVGPINAAPVITAPPRSIIPISRCCVPAPRLRPGSVLSFPAPSTAPLSASNSYITLSSSLTVAGAAGTLTPLSREPIAYRSRSLRTLFVIMSPR